MTLSTTIPASRTNLGMPLRVFAPYDAPDALAPMVRSILAFAAEVRSGEADSLTEWQYRVTYNDGRVRDYTFDGAEVVRGPAYVPGNVEDLREAFVAFRTEMFPTADKVDDTGEVVTDSLGYSATERKRINVRDGARRKIAAAMGFAGIKPWKAQGSPVNWTTVRAACKSEAAFDKIRSESELHNMPTGGSMTGATLSQSVIRPTRLPGQYQGHSHNN
jgi:hypothetical protein